MVVHLRLKVEVVNLVSASEKEDCRLLCLGRTKGSAPLSTTAFSSCGSAILAVGYRLGVYVREDEIGVAIFDILQVSWRLLSE